MNECQPEQVGVSQVFFCPQVSGEVAGSALCLPYV